MKKIIITTLSVLCCFIATLIYSCNKDIANDAVYGIDPSKETDLVNKALQLKGKLISGSMPGIGLTGTSSSIIINGFFDVLEISAGTILNIPYSTNLDSNVCKVYLQVEGADSYWEVPVERDTSYGQLYISIFVPNIIRDNNFNIIFSVETCSGHISSIVHSGIIVTETPTLVKGNLGDPRFNLQFTNHENVDLDLHVLTPSGKEIYYNNPTADRGSLDVDCLCDNCPNGPNENIFWEIGDAPRGQYKFWVEYYGDCGITGSPSNFILRVMKNANVVQTYTGTLYVEDSKSHIYTFNL